MFEWLFNTKKKQQQQREQEFKKQWDLLHHDPFDLEVMMTVSRYLQINGSRPEGLPVADWQEVSRLYHHFNDQPADDQRKTYANQLMAMTMTVFANPSNAVSRASFAGFFEVREGCISAQQAWQNLQKVMANPGAWRHLVDDTILTTWFALTFGQPQNTLMVLSCVLTHYQSSLADSQLLNPNLGLAENEELNKAKLAIKQVVQQDQHNAKLGTLIHLHGVMLQPLFEDSLESFQQFISCLDRRGISEFWRRQFANLPRQGNLLVAARAIELGLDLSQSEISVFRQPIDIEQANPWYLLKKDTVQILEDTGRKTPYAECVHRALVSVFSQANHYRKLKLDRIQHLHLARYLTNAEVAADWDQAIACSPHLLVVLRREDNFCRVMPSLYPLTAASMSLEKSHADFYQRPVINPMQALVITLHPGQRERLDKEAKDKQARLILISKSLYFASYFQAGVSLLDLALEDKTRCRRDFSYQESAPLKRRLIEIAYADAALEKLFKLMRTHTAMQKYVVDVYCKDTNGQRLLAEQIIASTSSIKRDHLSDFFLRAYTLRQQIMAMYQFDLFSGLKAANYARLFAARAINNNHKGLVAKKQLDIAAALPSCTEDFSPVLRKINDTTGCRELLYGLFRQCSAQQRQQLINGNQDWAIFDVETYAQTCDESITPVLSTRSSPSGSLYSRSESPAETLDNQQYEQPDQSQALDPGK